MHDFSTITPKGRPQAQSTLPHRAKLIGKSKLFNLFSDPGATENPKIKSRSTEKRKSKESWRPSSTSGSRNTRRDYGLRGTRRRGRSISGVSDARLVSG